MNNDGAILRSNSATLSRFNVCLSLYQVKSGAGLPSAAHFRVTWLPRHNGMVVGDERFVMMEGLAENEGFFGQVFKFYIEQLRTNNLDGKSEFF